MDDFENIVITGDNPPINEDHGDVRSITISVQNRRVSVLRVYTSGYSSHTYVDSFNSRSDKEIRTFFEELMSEATNFLEASLSIDSLADLFSVE